MMRQLSAYVISLWRLTRVGAMAVAAAASIGMGTGMASDKTWVATWAASPQPKWEGDFPLPTMLPFNLWNQTVRQRVRVSLGGKTFRFVLSNEYGDRPLTIDSVHIALPEGEKSGIDTKSDVALTFGGNETVTIPPGAPAISDPVKIDIPSTGEVVVTFFVKNPTPIDTFHWDGEQTGFIGAGNQVGHEAIADPIENTSRIFLTDVLVEAARDAKLVVAFGDSITDGAASGLDKNARWPDFLAGNLASSNVAVINAGISGACRMQRHGGYIHCSYIF